MSSSVKFINNKMKVDKLFSNKTTLAQDLLKFVINLQYLTNSYNMIEFVTLDFQIMHKNKQSSVCSL